MSVHVIIARCLSLAQVIVQLNLFLVGWILYYRYAACRFVLQRLDEWIRRRLRCYRLKQRKRGKSTANFLRRLGMSRLQVGDGRRPARDKLKPVLLKLECRDLARGLPFGIRRCEIFDRNIARRECSAR